MIVSLLIFPWFWKWKNFENRLIFGNVKVYKTCQFYCANFLGHPVHCWCSDTCLCGHLNRPLFYFLLIQYPGVPSRSCDRTKYLFEKYGRLSYQKQKWLLLWRAHDTDSNSTPWVIKIRYQTKLLCIFLLDINRFSKFFHRHTQQEICNKTLHIQDAPHGCRYTTLRNISFQKLHRQKAQQRQTKRARSEENVTLR